MSTKCTNCLLIYLDFDGAAFALFYYMGVLKYFEENVDIENVKFYANSAGNLAVLFYLAGETVTEEIINEVNLKQK